MPRTSPAAVVTSTLPKSLQALRDSAVLVTMATSIIQGSHSPTGALRSSTTLQTQGAKGPVEELQQQILQQRKIIDRCKAENYSLKQELDVRTKVLQTRPHRRIIASSHHSCEGSQVLIFCRESPMSLLGHNRTKSRS